MVGNDQFIPIKYSGGAILIENKPITLRDVLVSISKLTKDFPCYITFNKDNFVIKDVKTRITLITRIEENGLYLIKPAVNRKCLLVGKDVSERKL